MHLGFGLLARFMRQCAGVIAFGVDFSIEPLDQRITMQPCEQRDRVRHLGERQCRLLRAEHLRSQALRRPNRSRRHARSAADTDGAPCMASASICSRMRSCSRLRIRRAPDAMQIGPQLAATTAQPFDAIKQTVSPLSSFGGSSHPVEQLHAGRPAVLQPCLGVRQRGGCCVPFRRLRLAAALEAARNRRSPCRVVAALR